MPTQAALDVDMLLYDIFHANKNCFTKSLLLPTIDMYECLKLSDEFARELGKTHRLGNLNVKQSENCIEKMRANGHVREKHTDLTGGEERKLRQCKFETGQPDGSGFPGTSYAVLRPMLRAALDQNQDPARRCDAKACFLVAHDLWSLFDEAAALRLTVTKHGDFSNQHQGLVVKFFDILASKVNSELVFGMNAGLSYMSQPCHYIQVLSIVQMTCEGGQLSLEISLMADHQTK